MYARCRQDVPNWGPTIGSRAAVEEFSSLAAQIWDYAPKVLDVGMTHEFAGLFVVRVVARISDPEEM